MIPSAQDSYGRYGTLSAIEERLGRGDGFPNNRRKCALGLGPVFLPVQATVVTYRLNVWHAFRTSRFINTGHHKDITVTSIKIGGKPCLKKVLNMEEFQPGNNDNYLYLPHITCNDMVEMEIKNTGESPATFSATLLGDAAY